jgi:hypothetical protein
MFSGHWFKRRRINYKDIYCGNKTSDDRRLGGTAQKYRAGPESGAVKVEHILRAVFVTPGQG